MFISFVSQGEMMDSSVQENGNQTRSRCFYSSITFDISLMKIIAQTLNVEEKP